VYQREVKITGLGHQPVYKRPAPPPPVHQDVVLIGEMRSNQRLITRNNLLALFGTAVVSTTALLASGQQSALIAGLGSVPLGLVAARWLNSELRERGRQIEEQLNR
jgi:hypothetical protein